MKRVLAGLVAASALTSAAQAASLEAPIGARDDTKRDDAALRLAWPVEHELGASRRLLLFEHAHGGDAVVLADVRFDAGDGGTRRLGRSAIAGGVVGDVDCHIVRDRNAKRAPRAGIR